MDGNDSSELIEDRDTGPEVQINFPETVMNRIEELMGGTEQFDSAEFDAVAYINRMFPTEQSLSGVESAAARCEYRLAGVQNDIRRVVRAQHEQRLAGQKALLEAQKCIGELSLQLPEDGHICHPCFLLLSSEDASARVLGHTMVCLGCGRSVRDARHHIVESESPLLLDFSFTTRLQGITRNYICHPCWMRSNRQLHHDSSREETAQSSDNIQHEDALIPVQPEPPNLPLSHVLPPTHSPTQIMLPNYKRASNTSAHCIFYRCNNRSFHLIPYFIKRILLNDHNFYIPRSSRVCESHLYTDEWHLLPQNIITFSSFSANQIEDIIKISKSTGEYINFENIHEMPNHFCHYWTGLTVSEFLSFLNSFPALNVRKQKTALAIYLTKLRTGESNRRLSTIFNIPRSTLELTMKKVRTCLYENFVPQHIGANHISHSEIVSRNLRIPYALFGDPEVAPENRPAILMFDGTYIYLQKSANYMFQKKTYSLHKYDNLVKPFMIVSCDGHIIDVVGPFPATQTDAEIMTNLLENENSSYRRLFRANDIFILDRGFRDAIPTLESLNYRVFKPESLDEGQTQLTYSQANKSRRVTLCRWVVEVVNGRFKRDFKLFRQRYFNKAATHLMIDFKIAAAILNKFHPVLIDNPYCEQIIQRALRFMDEPNHLGQFVNDYNLNRRRVMFRRIDGNLPQLERFPIFSYDQLLLIALGPYQVKQARSYYGEHIRANGVYEVEVCPELDHSQEMVLQVTDISKAAERSESMVREITSEIKQLDCAKSNLTAAITTLNHFHMLVGGVDTLKNMTQSRQYKEIVLPLQAIMEVLQHFECYKDIKEINTLRDQVYETRNQLASQILADFKEAFTGGSKSTVSHKTLSEACAVVDTLDVKVKQDLLKWFISIQLQEYQHLFSAEQECAWLSHIERRYAWLKRHLLSFEETLGNMFPREWRLSERIAHQFCKVTRTELSNIMSSRRSEVDVKLLLYAIQKTYNFEMLLHKRFTGTAAVSDNVDIGLPEQLNFDVDKSVTDLNTQQPATQSDASSPWVGQIGGCFEPYLSLYINSLDANLRSLMDRFVQDAKSATNVPVGSTEAGAVLSSCADLFMFYKKCLVQCAHLTTGDPMLELAGVFQKYLREYASSVLQAALPRSSSTPNTGITLVTNLHTFLRDDDNTRFTKQEISKITSVITTSEYCLETTIHLEQKLKEKVAPGLADKIDLLPEQDLFHKIISNCIQMLIQDLELACDPALQTMTKISWLNFDNVGDQSSYVTQIIMHLQNIVPNLRDNLASSRKYFTQFCIRFANSFIPKFIQNIYKCKPISTVGSEQLLLDTHMLKTALLELPSIGSEVKRPAPATYTKVVIKLMTKAEMILKLVMAPIDRNLEGFITQFVQLLPECTLQEFHKVLDMKGAKFSKTQMSSLDALFKETSKSVHSDDNK